MTQLSLIDYAESVRLRDAGMALSVSADSDWVSRARAVAQHLAAKDGETDINSVYAVVGLPDHPNCAGSVFLPRNKWKCVGYSKSGRVKRHAGLIRRWSLA